MFHSRLTVLIPITFIAMSFESIIFILLLNGNFQICDACNSARKPEVTADTSNIDESVNDDESETAYGDIQSGGFNIVDLHLHSKILGLLITILIFVAVAGCILYICKQHCCKLVCCQPCCKTIDSISNADARREDRFDPPVRFSDVARLQEELNLRQPMIRQRPNFLSNRLQLLPPQPSYDAPVQFTPSEMSEEPIYIQLASSRPPQPIAVPGRPAGNADPIYATVNRQPISLPPPTASGAAQPAPVLSAPSVKSKAPNPVPRSSASLTATSTAGQPSTARTPALAALFNKEKESSL